jgi:hypothetical protein
VDASRLNTAPHEAWSVRDAKKNLLIGTLKLCHIVMRCH